MGKEKEGSPQRGGDGKKKDFILLFLPSLEIEEVIFGGLLGDFNLQSQTNGNTWRLRLMASNKHIEYINHLQELFDGKKTP
jgi:hypothetical protein